MTGPIIRPDNSNPRLFWEAKNHIHQSKFFLHPHLGLTWNRSAFWASKIHPSTPCRPTQKPPAIRFHDIYNLSFPALSIDPRHAPPGPDTIYPNVFCLWKCFDGRRLSAYFRELICFSWAQLVQSKLANATIPLGPAHPSAFAGYFVGPGAPRSSWWRCWDVCLLFMRPGLDASKAQWPNKAGTKVSIDRIWWHR